MQSNFPGYVHGFEISEHSNFPRDRIETTFFQILKFPSLTAKAVALLKPEHLVGAAETHLKFIWEAVCAQYQSPNSMLNWQNVCTEAKYSLFKDLECNSILGISIEIDSFFRRMSNFEAARYDLTYGNKLLTALIFDRDILAPFKLDASQTQYSAIDQFTEHLAKTQQKIFKLGDGEQQFKVYTPEELSKAEFEHKWLLDGILLANQPAIIAGPAKSLKTSLVAELAVSIGTGAHKCMGYFKNTQPSRRVGFLCGESGESTMKELMLRVCKSHQLPIEESKVSMCFRVPRVKDELYALTSMISEGSWEVVFIDPLYLSLLAGNDANPNASSNLHAMGTLLNDLCQTCLRLNCTPVLVHHTNKHLTGRKGEECFEPLEITDMHGAGMCEFARQWILVNRRERFEERAEVERVWFKYGGSAGHSGLWGVDIDQGRFDPSTCTRDRWKITVIDANSARDQGVLRKQQRREQDEGSELKEIEQKIIAVLRKASMTRTGAAKEILMNKDNRRFGMAFARLLQTGRIVTTGKKSRGGELYSSANEPG